MVIKVLKRKLTKVPVLVYLDFSPTARQFQLHTDASTTGLGAVLEQVAMCRTLTQAENLRNYSVIHEYFAIVNA